MLSVIHRAFGLFEVCHLHHVCNCRHEKAIWNDFEKVMTLVLLQVISCDNYWILRPSYKHWQIMPCVQHWPWYSYLEWINKFWNIAPINPNLYPDSAITWWRHQMETFSALLATCAGNSPVPGEFPTQRPVTQSFDVHFDLRPNKQLSKQS